jgi:hypothetical protein
MPKPQLGGNATFTPSVGSDCGVKSARITAIHPDGFVNIEYERDSGPVTASRVPVVEPGTPVPINGYFCTVTDDATNAEPAAVSVAADAEPGATTAQATADTGTKRTKRQNKSS